MYKLTKSDVIMCYMTLVVVIVCSCISGLLE